MSKRPLTGRVVIATHNAGKLAEMRDLLEPYGLELVSAGELGLPEPKEDGMMFAENAAIKAHAAAKASGLPAIADDSGLAVDALDGAPGLFTADWAGHPRDWMHAMSRVKAELDARDVEMVGAPARFVSALVVAWPDGETLLAEGRCYGHLTWPPRGEAVSAMIRFSCRKARAAPFPSFPARKSTGFASGTASSRVSRTARRPSSG